MTNTPDSRKYRKITERFCHEIGENVVLRSTSPDNETYECLHAAFCQAKDHCEKCRHCDE